MRHRIIDRNRFRDQRRWTYWIQVADGMVGPFPSLHDAQYASLPLENLTLSRTRPPLEGTTGQQIWRWLVADRLYRRYVLREVRRVIAEQVAAREAAATVREFTGSCPIREHTGDGAYVGRCDFATWDGFCPRHGAVDDYRPTLDDRRGTGRRQTTTAAKRGMTEWNVMRRYASVPPP